jgi:hypothetical protein
MEYPLGHGTRVTVTAPRFTASLVIFRNQVVECDPLLSRWVTRNRRASEVLDRFRAQGWRVEFQDAGPSTR